MFYALFYVACTFFARMFVNIIFSCLPPGNKYSVINDLHNECLMLTTGITLTVLIMIIHSYMLMEYSVNFVSLPKDDELECRIPLGYFYNGVEVTKTFYVVRKNFKYQMYVMLIVFLTSLLYPFMLLDN